MKRLIISFDGTWNAADSKKSNTNVVRLHRAIAGSGGGFEQKPFYIEGVGTSWSKILKVFEGATGKGVGDNIREGYRNLIENYQAGDEIYLFGFSRGAFSARSLAGLVSACGILKSNAADDIKTAWRFYRESKDRRPDKFSAESGLQIHAKVSITFLGVWDTVGALGVPVGNVASALSGEVFQFHDTSPSRIVKNACHALAIDERRDPFAPTFWTGTAPSDVKIEQVWFAGCHSDVGGGYDARIMADIPLQWMAKRAEAQGLALNWGVDGMPSRDGTLDPLSQIHDSTSGLSIIDKVTPTIRRVCEQNFVADGIKKIFIPEDKNGLALPTINESVHESVLARFGKENVKEKGWLSWFSSANKLYEPENLQPLFATSGKLKPGIKITT